MKMDTKAAPRWVLQAGEAMHNPLDPIAYLYQLLLPQRTVEAIYADWYPDGLEVWIVANDPSISDREQIYDQELALIQKFQNLGFDFHLVESNENDLKHLVSLDTADFYLRLPH